MGVSMYDLTPQFAPIPDGRPDPSGWAGLGMPQAQQPSQLQSSLHPLQSADQALQYQHLPLLQL